jgi:hypothetical protein
VPFADKAATANFDILERIAEHQVARVLEILLFPVMLEGVEPVEHGKQREIHRAHVERGQFRLEADGRLDALFDLHEGAAAAGEIHDGVRAWPETRQDRLESLRPLVGAAGIGVPGVQMYDRGASFDSFASRVGDFVRRDRQIGRHGGCVDRPGDGAGDDDLAAVR